MRYIDFTVQTQDENVALFEGGPTEHGLDGMKYIFLTDDYMEARIWLIGVVSDIEKQRIVHGVMSYLETEINAVDRSHETIFAH
jgi:hypothetical protein